MMMIRMITTRSHKRGRKRLVHQGFITLILTTLIMMMILKLIMMILNMVMTIMIMLILRNLIQKLLPADFSQEPDVAFKEDFNEGGHKKQYKNDKQY